MSKTQFVFVKKWKQTKEHFFQEQKEIETESIPAFITIIMMPLTYSISDGILCGMISYVAINACCGNVKKLSITMWVLAILFVLKYIFI